MDGSPRTQTVQHHEPSTLVKRSRSYLGAIIVTGHEAAKVEEDERSTGCHECIRSGAKHVPGASGSYCEGSEGFLEA
jgi:hypothetical protein